MAGPGNLRRAFVALLVLLIVTPQVLLRPCCCSRGAAVKIEASATASALPPCCLKRLQAAKTTSPVDSEAKQLNSKRTGARDSGRCACRTQTAVARTGRALFKAVTQDHFLTANAIRVLDLDAAASLNINSGLASHPPDPDWGGLTHLRLCRWVV